MIYDIAIIGAGPTGIGAAFEASKLGLKTIVFEKSEHLLATIKQYYKDGKRVDVHYKGQNEDVKSADLGFCDGSKESAIEQLEAALNRSNVELKMKTDIEKVSQKSDGSFTIITTSNDTFEAKFVVVSIGKMGAPNKPSYPIPAPLRKNIFHNANSINDGENVLIVGGGNSAVEYAIALCDNAKITLNYRKAEFNRINKENAKDLKNAIEKGKITPKFGIDIVGIEDVEGKCKVNFTDNNYLTFDKIIYAIGGASPVDFMQKCKIALDENNIPQVDSDGQSNIKGLFVGGDLLFKNGASIAVGLNCGYRAAHKIKELIK